MFETNLKERWKNTTLDWEQIHRRLSAAQAALESGGEPTPEETRRILQERAHELAREAAKEDEFLEVVEFIVANERDGIEPHQVREVYPVRELTELPCVPPFVLGVINVRGRIVSVVDIKKIFELPGTGLSDLNKAIIVSVGEMELGILADSVLGMRRVLLREIQPSLPTLTEIRAEYLKGISGDRLVILDAERILSDPRLVIDQQVEP